MLPQAGVATWVQMLAGMELPVLAHGMLTLGKLGLDADESPQEIADVVLHDPLLTVNVLRYVQEHRGRRRSTDITTVTHAVMMLGISPFHEKFQALATVEETLAGCAGALDGLRTVIRRARFAALCARDWARLRKDVDPEEVMVAALLHDLAEMLLWCHASTQIEAVAGVPAENPVSGPDIARQTVLGFPLPDLQSGLIKAWQLPELLRMLLDPQHAGNSRVLNVKHAVAVASHYVPGLDGAVLSRDFSKVGAWLGIAPDEVRQHVLRVAASAGDMQSWCGPAGTLPHAVESQVSSAAKRPDRAKCVNSASIRRLFEA